MGGRILLCSKCIKPHGWTSFAFIALRFLHSASKADPTGLTFLFHTDCPVLHVGGECEVRVDQGCMQACSRSLDYRSVKA